MRRASDPSSGSSLEAPGSSGYAAIKRSARAGIAGRLGPHDDYVRRVTLRGLAVGRSAALAVFFAPAAGRARRTRRFFVPQAASLVNGHEVLGARYGDNLVADVYDPLRSNASRSRKSRS